MTIRQDKKNLVEYHKAQAGKLRAELDSECEHTDLRIINHDDDDGWNKHLNYWHTISCSDCGLSMGKGEDSHPDGENY